MRHIITITGTLDTFADAARVEQDAPLFLREIERVHEGIVPGSVSLVSVEPAPEPARHSADEAETDIEAAFGDLSEYEIDSLVTALQKLRASKTGA